MSSIAPRRADYDDVLNAPAHVIAEVIDGVLHTKPRPRTIHAQTATVLGEELGNPFRRGRGGPGGWILLDEPELHLGADIVFPDLAGWRRSTYRLLDSHADDARVRAEPFEAFELELAALWAR